MYFRSTIQLLALTFILLTAVECAPPAASIPPAQTTPALRPIARFTLTANSENQTSDDANGTTGLQIDPNATPMPSTTHPTVEANNSKSGASGGGAPQQGGLPPPPDLDAQLDTALWARYTNDALHLSVKYPQNFSFKILTAQELATLTPTPGAAVYFQNRLLQSAALEPPAFTIRVFEKPNDQSLEEWLSANGLFDRQAGWTLEPANTLTFSATRVSSPLLMAPGVFYYIEEGDQIYQLTPLGAEGEAMLQTFALLR